MKNILIALAVVIVFIALFFFVRSYLLSHAPSTSGGTGRVKINNHTFKVYVAKTSKEKQIGLSSRKSLASDEGMIFPFNTSSYYSFWMKNMKFPIDIIYINKDKVVTVHKNVPAPAENEENIPVYRPDQPADTVFEINAGLSDKYSIKQGNTVDIAL